MDNTDLVEEMRGVYAALVVVVVSVLLGFFGAIVAAYLVLEALVWIGGMG